MRTEAERNDDWAQHPDATALARQELPSYCLRQRWYPAKDAGRPEFTLQTLLPLEGEGSVALAIWRVTAKGRDPFQLFIPLAVVSPKEATDDLPVIGGLPDGRLIMDAMERDDIVRQLVQLMLQGPAAKMPGISTGRTDQIASLRDLPESQWTIKRSRAEQSNTSIRIADRGILKVIRKIAPGIHPELDMGRFLTEVARFRATPALLGWLNVGGATVAILQQFIPNSGDGWTWIRSRLQGGDADREQARRWLGTLGRRTAELHQALDTTHADPAFCAETAGEKDWARWGQDLAEMAQRVRDALAANASTLDPETRGLADKYAEVSDRLDPWLRSIRANPPVWRKTRHHGDFHLGQVLVAGDDAVIVDFEGEPLRSLEERRAKHVPLRDVAGLLRSINYASEMTRRGLSSDLSVEQRSREAERLEEWATNASQEFLESYLQCLGEMSAEALDQDAARRMVQFFVIEKALYEVLYELANRPTWTSIPLKSVVAQLTTLRSACADSGGTGARSRH
jgi:trehalose synthase-fused probable maltokinase